MSHSNDPHYNNKKGGHFFNGFFLGTMIGGGVTYLLSTKKGRDLLRELIQDGIDMLDNATVPKEEPTPVYDIREEGIVEEVNPIEEVPHSKNSQSKKEAPKKRFFRKVGK